MWNEPSRWNVPNLNVRIDRSDAPPVPKHSYPTHYHDALELLYIDVGEYIVTVNEKDYRAPSGELVFINSGVPHETRSEVPSRALLVQFRENDFLDPELNKIIKYSRRRSGLLDSEIRIINDPELVSAVKEMLSLSGNFDTGYDFLVKSSVYKILGLLYRKKILASASDMLASREMQKILPVLAHVNLHYSEDITLADASSMLNFDESYFCRIFKNATGATFTEYLNFVRICKAEKKLRKTQDSILEISESVGFSSVSYFNRIFKKYRHLSPRAYRSLEGTGEGG